MPMLGVRLFDVTDCSTSPESSSSITVIMPCYNSAVFVREAVDSVCTQTFATVDLIAIDDGSTDRTLEILASAAKDYPGRVTVIKQEHSGPYPARNLGIAQATGEFLAFLDADDYWDPTCLKKLMDALCTASADVAYCGWKNVGEGAPGDAPYIPADYLQMDTVAEFLRACPWPIHAALVRRTALEAVGGFSTRRFSAMDYDLWVRLYAHTQRLVRVPEVLAYYRWHNMGQISRSRWRQILDAVQVRIDFVAQHPRLVSHLLPEQKKALTWGVILREAYRAFYSGDFDTAQKLFRAAAVHGVCSIKDLKYVGAALLPGRVFRALAGRGRSSSSA